MQEQKPAIMINSQYIKDLSMEIPHAPQVFNRLNENPPKIDIEVNLESKKLENNFYNVIMNVTMNGNMNDEKIFILCDNTNNYCNYSIFV